MLLADTDALIRTSPVGFGVAFAGGALSFLSPCVLPLVPGYLSLMSGVSTAEVAGAGTGVATKASTRRILRSTLLFVAGFTVAFTVLGLTIVSGARSIGLSPNTLDVISGVVIIVMGLLVAGVIAPGLLQREARFHVSPSKLGPLAAPVMGMAFAVGWTPCIGPILTAVLALASNGTPVRGTLMLIVYSLGLGVPFVATGLAFGRLTTAFAWVKRHFRPINLVSGLLLAAFGVLLATHNLQQLSIHITNVLKTIGLKRLTSS